ncbi:putative P2Y purinoceptor 10 [Hippocampus zosterae]|uniref:putative P2Y purinoceptor 10 n=1 Tax=Hippocampus zosterae TaxID=109293 RepID=UPI00223DDC96|nr:putative P2Y purinoceptor 10 [Hippocampus zosterae]XP_051913988.1 putative P2Y purinoceptor 10 [Hippocampus zosterae]
MTLNTSQPGPASQGNSSCDHDMTEWEELMNKLYTYFYLLLFIPGMLLNTMALWFLCRHIRKKTKTVIFMINLALADLVHILSLPLRIYYYLTHTWPFGHSVCLLCFYLKYLNMYAAIGFLMCISVQRCVFLLDPFYTRKWRSRYDLVISIVVWLLVALACSPFILMRASSNSGTAHSHLKFNKSSPLNVTVTSLTSSLSALMNETQVPCFKDLPMRHVPFSLAVTLMVLAELFGFVIPLACISWSSICISCSFYQKHNQISNKSTLCLSMRSRPSAFTSADKKDETQRPSGEKQRALRMVLSCTFVFLLCFAPYHINFLLYLMVQQNLVSECATRLAVRQFHPVSLCLASLSCCLNPLLYYFLTAEFRLHLRRQTSSFTSSLVSSKNPVMHRLLSFESSSSK